jgi:hypothetical protein
MICAAAALTFVVLTANPVEGRRPTKAELQEAQTRFTRATDLYEDNDLVGALAEFRKAYALAPNFRLLYNIGQVCFALQNYPAAIDAFTRYLADGEGEISASRLEDVQRELTRLRTRVAKLRISAPDQAEITIDEVVVGKAPLESATVVAAGRHRISATLKGHTPVTKMVEVAGMESVNVDLEFLDEAPGPKSAVAASAPVAPGVTQPPPSGSSVPVVPWILTGVVAAGAGVMGGLSLATSGELAKKRGVLGANPTELKTLSTRTKTFAASTDVLLALTVAGAAISTYLTFWGGKASPSALSFSVSPVGVAATGSF